MDTAALEASPADQRSGEILDRIKSVFSAKGFDGASMQDLAQAAGMSAGNFYRYFPSKSAIVEALAQRNLERMEADFQAVRNSANPRQAFREMLYSSVEQKACEDAPIWAEICATSFRKPEIAALEKRMHNHVEANLVAAFAQITGHDPDEAARLFSVQARMIILLVKSLSTVARGALSGRGDIRDRELVAMVLKTIEDIVAKLPQAGDGAGETAGEPKVREG